MSEQAPPTRTDAPAPGPELARVNYTVTADDLRVVYSRYYHEMYKVENGALTRRKHIVWMIVAIISALGLAVIGYLDIEGTYKAPAPVVMCAFFPLCVALLTLGSRRDQRQHQASAMLNHAMRTKVVNDFFGNHALWFNDTYVYEQHPGESRGLSWFHIAHVDIDPAFVTFVQTDTRGTHIPIRAFASQADVERFVELAQQTLHASGYGDTNWIAKCLASHDCPCPKCKYNLRGTTGGACPECGHPLNRETLPWAFLVDAAPPTTK